MVRTALRGCSWVDCGSILVVGLGGIRFGLLQLGLEVTALDFSDGMLAVARAKPQADGVRFMVHDLRLPLPFSDASFDLVVSGLVLEHLADLEPFFAEARRVLKHGGRAVISAMHPAMFLRGTQARFTDPASGEIVSPGSLAHSVSAFVMAAVRAGVFDFGFGGVFAGCRFMSSFYGRRSIWGWPMLVVFVFSGLT